MIFLNCDDVLFAWHMKWCCCDSKHGLIQYWITLYFYDLLNFPYNKVAKFLETLIKLITEPQQLDLETHLLVVILIFMNFSLYLPPISFPT